MAFLPGMLSRNKGHILSIAMDNKSSLANSGMKNFDCDVEVNG